MLLLATTTAFRGGSCRAVQLSDMFLSELPVLGGHDIGSGVEVIAVAGTHEYNGSWR